MTPYGRFSKGPIFPFDDRCFDARANGVTGAVVPFFRSSILKNHGFVEDQRRKLLSTEIRSRWQARSIGRSKEQIFFRLFFALVPLCGKDSSYTRRGGSTLRDYSEIFGEKFSLWNSTERD